MTSKLTFLFPEEKVHRPGPFRGHSQNPLCRSTEGEAILPVALSRAASAHGRKLRLALLFGLSKRLGLLVAYRRFEPPVRGRAP